MKTEDKVVNLPLQRHSDISDFISKLLARLQYWIRLFAFFPQSNKGRINYQNFQRLRIEILVDFSFYRTLHFLVPFYQVSGSIFIEPNILTQFSFLIFCWSFKFVANFLHIRQSNFQQVFFFSERIRMNLVLVVTIN